MKRKGQHHKGSYHRLSTIMNRQATADPTTTCWRDGLTLNQHGPGRTWTCGHIRPDELHIYNQHPSRYATTIDGRLCAPEVNRCNYSNGATHGNTQRNPTSRHW